MSDNKSKDIPKLLFISAITGISVWYILSGGIKPLSPLSKAYNKLLGTNSSGVSINRIPEKITDTKTGKTYKGYALPESKKELIFPIEVVIKPDNDKFITGSGTNVVLKDAKEDGYVIFEGVIGQGEYKISVDYNELRKKALLKNKFNFKT